MKYGKAQENSVRQHKLVKKAIGEIKEGFTGIFKLTKWLAIEFGVMSLALGAVELAFYAAQIAAKAWNFTLNALGAAAGVAVGGLTAVMAALRQLQTARMQPLFGAQRMGGRGAASQMNMLLGDPRLGMFDDASLIGAIESARRSGMEVNVRFRQAMEQLGNFAVIGTGDPSKNLGALVGALGQINTEGKVTRDTFDEIAKTSPELARAFGKLAGSKATDPKHMLKAGQNAADAGKISAQRFTEALMSGELGAQYANVLDSVNQTLIGRFKSQWKRMKQALVEVGNPILDIFNTGNNNPIEEFGNRVRFSLYQLSPLMTREFKRINAKLFGSTGLGTFDNAIDALVRRIYSGMPKLIGWGEGIVKLARNIRGFFQDIAPWFRDVSKGWDSLYAGFVRPIGMEVFNTITHAIDRFSESMTKMDTQGFAQAIGTIGESVRKLIDQFANIREILAPVVEGILRFIGALMNNKVSALFAVLAALGAAFLKIELAAIRIGPAFAKAGLQMQKSLQGVSERERQVEAAMNRKNIKAEAQTRILQQNAEASTIAAGGMNTLTKSEQRFNKYGGIGNVPYGPPAPPKVDRWAKLSGRLNVAALPMMMAGTYIMGKADAGNGWGQMLGGALAGAGTGAMIGGMFGGAGAPIGAAIGGLTGGIMGLWKSTDALRKQREEEIAERSNKAQNEAYSFIANQMGTDKSDPRVAMAAFERLRVGRDTLANSAAVKKYFDFRGQYRHSKYRDGPGWYKQLQGSLLPNFTYKDGMLLPDSELPEFNKALEGKKQLDAYNKALREQGPGVVRLAGNFEILSNVMGMTGDEINSWVQRTGYEMDKFRLSADDLFTKVLGYGQDALANLGVAAGRLRDALQAPITRLMQMMDTRIQADEAWQDIKYAGPMSADQAEARALAFMNTRTDYVASQMAAGRYKGKGGARQAQREFYSPESKIAMLRQIQDPGMQAAVGRAFDLAAQEFAELVKPENIMKIDPEVAGGVRDRLNAYVTGIVNPELVARSDWALSGLTMPRDAAGNYNFGVGLSEDEKKKILEGDRGVAAAVGSRALAAINSGEGAFGGIQNPDVLAALKAMDPATLGQMMANKLYDPTNPNNLEAQLNAGGALAAQQISDAITGALEKTTWTMPTFTATVGNDGTLTFSQVVGDTSTARGGAYGDTSSRWARTFGSHARYNQMIPGSRTITSGVRNYALGSPSSDHRFGRAYDLTGDNLGMYAGQVRSDGGFAEFHGSAGGRHLHVVPSPTAAGDTSVPASIGVRSSGGGSSMTQTVSFNITAGPNASPEEIARAVMTKLRQAERSAQERI